MLFSNKAIFNGLLALSLILSVGCSSQPQSNEELGALKQEIEALKAEKLKTQTTDLETSTGLEELENKPLKEAVAETLQPQFTDLDDELATTPLIQDLVALGMFKSLDTEFKPYDTITRGEYVTWLYKSHNVIAKKPADRIQLAPAFDPGFSDLEKAHPAYKYVASMANAGYSVGYDDKTFKPDQAITREEMLVIKVGVDSGKALSPNLAQMAHVWKFSDSESVDPRYTGYIREDYYTTNPNINRCFGKIGTLKPKQAVLRHEAAASLWQFGHWSNMSETTAKHALSR